MSTAFPLTMPWQAFTGKAATLESDGRSFIDVAEARVSPDLALEREIN